MKVRIDVTIDVDAEGWALEYGLGPDASDQEIREDIKQCFAEAVRQHLDTMGLSSD